MNSIKSIFSLLALFFPCLMAIAPSSTLAQQPSPNLRKEHLEYCGSKLTVEVGQLEAIKGVMGQDNLMPIQKMEQVSQILSPQQKQQIQACMQQPMPSQPQGAPQR